MSRFLKYATGALLAVVSSSVFAASGWFGDIGADVDFSTTGDTQTLSLITPPSSPVSNTYSANNAFNTALGGTAGLGYELDPWSLLQFAFSEDFTYVNYDAVGGIEYPLSNLINTGNTLAYTYNASSYVLLTDAKLLFGSWSLRPFAIGGVGVAWNELSNFSETLRTGTASSIPVPFADNTSSANLAYTVGGGLNYTISKNFGCALTYRYINAGNGELGTIPTQTTTARLQSGTLSANLIEVSLSFM